MKKTLRSFLTVLVAAVTLVCCMSVAVAAAAPADGTIYPIFVLAETQPQYKFYYTTAAKGTDPMTGRVDASVGENQKVTYENDGTFNLIIDKLDAEMGRAMIAFIAPADGEYKVEMNTGLWNEGEGTSYDMAVYADGKLVDHVENVGGRWGANAVDVTVKVRAGKEICIVPGVADNGGSIGAPSQPLKIVNYKLTYVKAATFEDETPDTNPDEIADTSDSAIAIVAMAVACGAALAVVCKKSHR